MLRDLETSTRMGRAVLALGCALGVAACDGSDGGPSVNVGMLLPFTGEVGAMGMNLEEAAMMVADRVNAHGGVTGKRIRLVVRDTHSEVNRALASLDELMEEGVVAVIGPESAEIAAAVYPILKDHQIAFVSPYGSGALDSVDAEHPWFRLAPTPISIGQSLANHMVIDDHVTQAVIVYTSDRYNSALADAAAARFRMLNGQVLEQVALPAGLSDYSGQIVRLLDSSPQVVLLAADSMSGAGIVNGISIVHPAADRRWYLAPSLKTSSFLRNAFPDKIEGATGVAPSIISNAAFAAEFTSAWNGDEPQDGAYYYYDALALVSLGVERAWIVGSKQEITYAGIRDGIKDMARTYGVSNDWASIPAALDQIRGKMPAYYSGLSGSGPILFDARGERQNGTTRFWKVTGGAIVDL